METSEPPIVDRATDSDAFSSDRPIETDADDKLGRRRFADALAKQILSAPRTGSCVFGLLGPWGSGKSSVLNLVESRLLAHNDVVVIRFNPWLFSGAEQLVAHFFHEVAGQLREQTGDSLKAIWRAFEVYSRLFANLRLVAAPGKTSSQAQTLIPSAAAQRQSLKRALSQSAHRLVIILDDIDRLRQDEIRDVMRLVRLVGEFPNTTYLLAFDRQRVEKALETDDERGRAYLEKIMQVAHDLPEMRHSDIVSILSSKIKQVLQSQKNLSPVNLTEELNKSSLLISPMFLSLRDVSRYINALYAAFDSFEDEIAVGDLLALEALRCLMPETYAHLPSMEKILAPDPRNFERQVQGVQGAHDPLEAFIHTAGVHKEIVRTLCARLFPASRRLWTNDPELLAQWRREGRVAHNDVFRIYLERSIPNTSLPRSYIRKLFGAFEDEDALRTLLSEVADIHLEDLLKRLGDYASEYKPTMVPAAVSALLNIRARLPVGRRRTAYFRECPAVDQVVSRLLLAEQDPSTGERIVPIIFAKIGTLSAKSAFLQIVERVEKPNLVSEQTIKDLESELLRQAMLLSIEALAQEQDLAIVIAMLTRKEGESARQKVLKFMKNDNLLIAFLCSDLTEHSPRFEGDSVERTEYHLPLWDKLEELCGTSVLAERIERLRVLTESQKLDTRSSLAIGLAVQYRDGRRPPEHPRRTIAVSKNGTTDDITTDDSSKGSSSDMGTDQDQPCDPSDGEEELD